MADSLEFVGRFAEVQIAVNNQLLRVLEGSRERVPFFGLQDKLYQLIREAQDSGSALRRRFAELQARQNTSLLAMMAPPWPPGGRKIRESLWRLRHEIVGAEQAVASRPMTLLRRFVDLQLALNGLVIRLAKQQPANRERYDKIQEDLTALLTEIREATTARVAVS